MDDVSRDPREHWLKPHFSKNEVANSGPVCRESQALISAAKKFYPRFGDCGIIWV